MNKRSDPINELKTDHEQVRDYLLDLIDASARRDAKKALELLLTLDKLTGPHFRFEEESLYPVQLFSSSNLSISSLIQL